MNLLLVYIGKYKKLLGLALFLAAINQIFSLLDPQIFRLIIDKYASRASEFERGEFISGVLILLVAAIAVAFISRVAKNFQDYFVNVITQRVGAGLYARSIGHSFSLPYSAFEDQRSGELLLQLQKARADSQTLTASSINVVFFSIIGILFVLIYAFWVHWAIGLLYFLLVPSLGSTTYLISRKIKAAQSKIVKETAELAGSTTETIRNVELVKSLGLEEQETKRLNAVNERILVLELQKVRMIRKLSFIQGTLINAMRSSILLLMLWLIFSNEITLGQFFSLFIYSFFIFQPLSEFGTVASNYQEAKASMEALEKILSIPAELKPQNPHLVNVLEKIEFKSASFSYLSSPIENRGAIANVSVTLEKGKSYAFVGPSGAGKSTLLKLILGLYKPTKGKLLINGISSDLIDYDAFRRKIGYVSQDTQLFAGTIRENLLFVEPDATDSDCLAALEAAAAFSILERGGQGLDTKIGEGGIKISGGEKQRIAIARALLRKPDLIIFDEATSSLDSITEKAITQTIKLISNIYPNLMLIIVAHRLSTVSHADVIHVLEKGSVVESGNQKELVKAGNLFAALWREQVATSN